MNNPTDNYVSKQFSPLVIEAESSRLEREAQQAQAAWFAAPNDPVKKAQYAVALRRWARETKNKTALAHAESLLGEAAQ